MTVASLIFTVLKILVVIMFLMNTAAILTWAERRQSAMIQDRVGPNRAVIYIPAAIVKALLAGLGFGLAALAALYFALPYLLGVRRPPGVQLSVGFMLTELAVLVCWLLALSMRSRAIDGSRTVPQALARIEDPRIMFFVGLFVHVVVAVLWIAASPEVLLIVSIAGTALLCAALAASGAWGAMEVAPGKFGLRLAGLLHPLADGAKFAFKEDFIPANADRLLHSLGPLIALFPALVTFAVVPFGDTLCLHPGEGGFWASIFGAHAGDGNSAFVPRSGICADVGIPFQIASLNVGILYMFALAGTGIIGAAIAGYSSDNKFSLLGGLRASSQMVSYEVAMGLSLVGAFMVYGSVRLDDMVRWQGDHAWGIFVQPVAFFLFLAAAIAEQKRTPFDSPEGESEIVAGYLLEYSGMKFGMFYLGEYMEVATSSALLTTIFFGGYNLPFLHRDGLTIAFGDTVLLQQKITHGSLILLGVLTFFGKTVLLCWAQLFIRWTIPRFRYDQIMKLGWRMLLPFAMINLLVTAMVLLAIDRGGVALSDALHLVGDITQAVVGVGSFALVVWLVALLLKPRTRKQNLTSSSAQFAQAQGGTKMTPMQA